ncbi:response regulator [Myxococcota bacterium]|nr:response regulator [Myxococcota bacterium]
MAPRSGHVRPLSEEPPSVFPSRAPRRVLVVEDNAVNQLVLTKMLEKLGHAFEVVPNGRVAVERLTSATFDVVLMDLQMPVLDGYSATVHIRAIERPGARTPIIAVTASTTPGDRERCLACGMDDYLSKPLELATLGRTLDRWTEDR